MFLSCLLFTWNRMYTLFANNNLYDIYADVRRLVVCWVFSSELLKSVRHLRAEMLLALEKTECPIFWTILSFAKPFTLLPSRFQTKKKMIESSSRLFKVTGPWSDCVAGNFNYTSNYASIADEVYPQIFAMAPNLDIMIYSGDAGLCCCVFGLLFFPCFVDACVPFFGTVQWTSQIGGTVTDAWRPWQSSGQLAGGCWFCFFSFVV